MASSSFFSSFWLRLNAPWCWAADLNTFSVAWKFLLGLLLSTWPTLLPHSQLAQMLRFLGILPSFSRQRCLCLSFVLFLCPHQFSKDAHMRIKETAPIDRKEFTDNLCMATPEGWFRRMQMAGGGTVLRRCSVETGSCLSSGWVALGRVQMGF